MKGHGDRRAIAGGLIRSPSETTTLASADQPLHRKMRENESAECNEPRGQVSTENRLGRASEGTELGGRSGLNTIDA